MGRSYAAGEGRGGMYDMKEMKGWVRSSDGFGFCFSQIFGVGMRGREGGEGGSGGFGMILIFRWGMGRRRRVAWDSRLLGGKISNFWWNFGMDLIEFFYFVCLFCDIEGFLNTVFSFFFPFFLRCSVVLIWDFFFDIILDLSVWVVSWSLRSALGN